MQSPEIQFDGGLSGNNLSKILDNLNSSSAASPSGASNTVQTPSGPKQEKKIMVKDFVVQNAEDSSESHSSRNRQGGFHDRATFRTSICRMLAPPKAALPRNNSSSN